MRILNKICNFLTFFLFFLMTFLPRSHSNMKLPLFLILIVISLGYIIFSKKKVLSKNTLSYFYVYILFGLLWCGIAIYNNNVTSQVFSSFKLYVLWPMVYLIFGWALIASNKIELIFKTLIISNFSVSIYTILLYLNSVGITSFQFLYKLDEQARVGIHEGYVQITSHNIGTLIFSVPFIITLFLFGGEKQNKKWLLVNSILGGSAIFLSGRRALLLVIMLIPVFYLIFSNIYSKKNRLKTFRYVVILIAFSSVLLFLLDGLQVIEISAIFNRFVDSFTGSEDNVRIMQIKALFDGFKERPIIGTGFGKGVSTIVRSADDSSSYEVVYMALLYNTGIIGIGIYLGLMVYNVVLFAKTSKKNLDSEGYMFALLLGFLSFIISNFSNPYIGSFEFIWIVFIIVIYHNYLLVREVNHHN